eukprot:jgi/Mesvir1/22894/Mv19417-RA.1
MFGMTMLGGGDGSTFAKLASTIVATLGSLSDEKVLDVYDRLKEPAAPRTPDEGQMVLKRALIPDLLKEAMGRELTIEERTLMLKTFDVAVGTISREQLLKGMNALRERSGRAESPSHYKSLEAMKHDSARHRRSPLDPKDMYAKPLTANQDYGWHPEIVAAPDRKNLRKGTDVTKGEGMSVDMYYGTF